MSRSRSHILTAAVLLSAVFGAANFAAAIDTTDPAPPLVLLFQREELHAQNGRLQLVQTGVSPLDFREVAPRPSVLPEPLDMVGQQRVSGRDRAPIAIRPEILGGVERERGCPSKGARLLSVVGRSMALGAVFQQHQVAIGRQAPEALKVRDPAVEMNGEKEPHCRSQDPFDAFDIERQGFLVHIRQARLCPGEPHAGQHGNAGVGGDHDFVVRPGARGDEQERDGLRSVAAGDHELDAEVAGQLGFESGHLRAENESPARKDAQGRWYAEMLLPERSLSPGSPTSAA